MINDLLIYAWSLSLNLTLVVCSHFPFSCIHLCVSLSLSLSPFASLSLSLLLFSYPLFSSSSHYFSVSHLFCCSIPIREMKYALGCTCHATTLELWRRICLPSLGAAAATTVEAATVAATATTAYWLRGLCDVGCRLHWTFG